MIKRKNILAENMLRFRSKNIAAEEAAAIRKLIEQQTKMTVKNVDLITSLKGKLLAVVYDPLKYDLIAFPSTGKPMPNAPAIINKEGAVYQSGTGYRTERASYVLLGNIGNLTGGDGNWGIANNSGLKVFTYMKSTAESDSATGGRIIPEAPYVTPTTVTDPAVIISTLTKAKYGDGYLLNQNPQKYIADLVKLFQTMNQLTNVATTRDSIMAYTRNVVAKVK
jgi:hypothetical protein